MLRGDSVPSFKHDRVTPAQIIILGFLLLIFTGAVLLMLPFSTQEPGGASFGDALFTATSATCVTGLVLHDTALYWSPFGQLVILLLIQVGGMGVVTIAVAIFMFEAAVGDAGVHFRPSGGRHRADDGVYPKNRLFD